MTEATKAQARYQERPNGREWCARCSMFRSPDECTTVKGEVKPTGWCKYFDMKHPGREAWHG